MLEVSNLEPNVLSNNNSYRRSTAGLKILQKSKLINGERKEATKRNERKGKVRKQAAILKR